MRFFLFLFCCVTTLAGLRAQGHQPVFPALDGPDLLEAVSDDFTPASVLSYGAARDILFRDIDARNDTLYCVYTDWPIYLPPGEDPTTAAFQNGQGINTEHTWPQSLGASEVPPRSNMHHLFPTRVDVNGDRGSLPFGEVPDELADSWYYLASEVSSPPSSNRDAYSENWQNTAFEPREVFKGNIARAMMYFYTIYRSQANANAPSFFNDQREALCQWHANDPVDEQEWNRTFFIAIHQDDKPNPFVLDCTLAARLYCPELLNDNCITTVTEYPDLLPLTASVFPNPARQNSQLKVVCPQAGDLQLRYFDSLGRLVQSEGFRVAAGTNEIQLQLPQAGFWHCEIILQSTKEVYRQTIPIMVLP
jgi:endonuclease I